MDHGTWNMDLGVGSDHGAVQGSWIMESDGSWGVGSWVSRLEMGVL